MPQIHWGGVIEDPAAYQQGVLPQGAHRITGPDTTARLLLAATPFAVPAVAVLVLSMLGKSVRHGGMVVSPPWIVLGVLLGLLLLAVHELLHAAAYPPQAVVTIGVLPRQFAAVALVSYPLRRGRFLLMLLLPFVLGLTPLLAFWCSPAEKPALNGVLFGLAAMGMVSPYPDVYNAVQVLRQAPRGANVQFWGEGLYCLP